MKKENRNNLILFIFIFITILSIIIIKPINDLDELWNYNTARAISEGLIPYKDISMITTPLLPMITAMFLNLVSNQVLVTRILAALLCSGILYIIYKILRILVKEENICLICTALIGILFREIYCIDYNMTILFISLIILYKELKETSKDKRKIYNKKTDIIIRNISRIGNLYKAKYRNNTCCNYSNI